MNQREERERKREEVEERRGRTVLDLDGLIVDG